MKISKLLTAARQRIQAGDLGETRLLCEKILKKRPGNPDAIFLLGAIELLKKNYDSSKRFFEDVLRARPGHIEATNNLAVISLEQGRLDEAENYCKQVIKIDGSHTRALNNLGNVYLRMGREDDAEELYRRALAANPEDGITRHNLGAVLMRKKEFDEAVEHLKKALHLIPENPLVYMNLGLVLLFEKNDMPACVDLPEKIMRLPNPGSALLIAFAAAKKIVQLDTVGKVRDKLLRLILDGEIETQYLSMVYLDLLTEPEIDDETLLAVIKKTGSIIDRQGREGPFCDYDRAMQSMDKLRIGYLSGDFRMHVVTKFFRGLINFYDKQRFEVYCYSTIPEEKEDEKTVQYKRSVDAFVNVSKLTDIELASRICQDGIHILVDLSGYTKDGRLSVMGYRPAPVQITYLGYPYSTGLESVDYIISDPYLDGPRNAEFCTEKPLRLYSSAMSFGELEEQNIDPTPPFERDHFITFGTLSNIYKFNSEVIHAWSEVLRGVPTARFIINHPNCAPEIARRNILNEFAKYGISEGRIKFIWEKHPEGSHLRYYNDIDIALDTFPLTGGTTTIDAVWMGIPVVTLIMGETHRHRLSYSVLSNIGIRVDDLISFSKEEYIQKAVTLANNPIRASELRRTIPEAIKGSIMCNPEQFARHIEAAYIDAWNMKFPDRMIDTDFKGMPSGVVPIAGGVEMVVSGSLSDHYTYILKEQQGWFDQEYAFVQKLIQPKMRIVDIGAGIGVYAIPLAKRVTNEGYVWAVTTKGVDAKYLFSSQRHNSISNLEIIESTHEFCLNEEEARNGWSDVDFMRIDSKMNNGKGGILRQKGKLLSEGSPLVMFGIKHEDKLDLSLIPLLCEMGYAIYRLIPGIDVLVPYVSSDALDAFSENLFCCKAERAELLQRQGYLIQQPELLKELPDVSDKIWLRYIGVQPYTANLISSWMGELPDLKWRDLYQTALSLFAMAREESKPASGRYACLQTSHSLLSLIVEATPNISRLISLARVSIEFGRRELAVNILNQIDSLIRSNVNLDISEPFIALSDEWAAINHRGRVAEWLIASIWEQREKLRAFSSFFTEQTSLVTLEEIQKTGFISEEMRRRMELIKMRYRIES